MNDKLVKIQQQLKAPKSEYNSFAKFSYRSAENILEAVKPLIHELGLALTLTDEVVNIGNSNYVKALVMLTDGTDYVSASAYAREEETKKGMDAAQITGSASSYARKYALNGLFAIDDTKDADSHDNTQHETTQLVKKVFDAPLNGLATEKQRETIMTNLEHMGIVDINDQKDYLIDQYGAILPLSKTDASDIIEDLFEQSKDRKIRERATV